MADRDLLLEIRDKLGDLPQRLATALQGSSALPPGPDGGGGHRQPRRTALEDMGAALGRVVPIFGEIAQMSRNLRGIGDAFSRLKESFRGPAPPVQGPPAPTASQKMISGMSAAVPPAPPGPPSPPSPPSAPPGPSPRPPGPNAPPAPPPLPRPLPPPAPPAPPLTPAAQFQKTGEDIDRELFQKGQRERAQFHKTGEDIDRDLLRRARPQMPQAPAVAPRSPAVPPAPAPPSPWAPFAHEKEATEYHTLRNSLGTLPAAQAGRLEELEKKLRQGSAMPAVAPPSLPTAPKVSAPMPAMTAAGGPTVPGKGLDEATANKLADALEKAADKIEAAAEKIEKGEGGRGAVAPGKRGKSALQQAGGGAGGGQPSGGVIKALRPAMKALRPMRPVAPAGAGGGADAVAAFLKVAAFFM